jgi:hypothetical protein
MRRKKKKKCVSLGKSNHILDTFCFVLQVCRFLIEAAKSGDVKTTKRWAHCNSDSCTTEIWSRQTPLILAVDNNHMEVVRVLLEGGVDVQRGDVNGHTPLFYAAEFGRLELCRLLLDKGANVNIQGAWKESVLHRPAQYGYLSVVKLLVEGGADVRLKDTNGRTAADRARGNGHTAVANWLDSISRG